MTEKDYELIAQAMNKKLGQEGVDLYTWIDIVNSLAFAFMRNSDQPFDFYAFKDACGWVECTGQPSENC